MAENTKLNILWTNDNPTTAEFMVFMYGINAKKRGWWDDVIIIIWGASAKLVPENPRIQDLIKEAKYEGLHISACKSCADQLGVSEALENLDIELIYWGEPLTQILREDEKLITI